MMIWIHVFFLLRIRTRIPDPDLGSCSRLFFTQQFPKVCQRKKKLFPFFYRYPVPDPDLGWPYNADLDMKLWS